MADPLGPPTYLPVDVQAGIDAGSIAIGALDLVAGALAEVPGVDILGLIAVILGALGLGDIFAGRPRDQATEVVITRLSHSKNPAGKIAALMYTRLLQSYNIVLSSSDPGAQHMLAQVWHQAAYSLEQQGLTPQHAQDVIIGVLQHTTGPDEPLPPPLDQPMPPGYQIWGAQQLESDYQQYLQQHLAQGKPQDVAERDAWGELFQREQWGLLLTLVTAQQDPYTRSGSSGGVSAPPPPEASDCADPCMQAIIASVTNLTAALAGSSSPLAALASAMPEILQAIQTADLGRAASALDALAQCVCPQLDKIAQAIRDQTQSQDVPQDIIDQLVREGSISSAMGQLASGAPIARVVSALLGSVARYLGGELGEVEHGLGKLLTNLIEPWGRQLISVVQSVAGDFMAGLQDVAPGYTQAIESAFGKIFTALSSIESALPRDLFEAVVRADVPPGGVTADNVEQFVFRMLGSAFIIGQGIHLLAGLAGYLGYPMSSLFGHNAQLAVKLLAYDEIQAALHGAFFPAAIGNRAQQRYNAMFPTRVPMMGAAEQLYARRIISAEQLRALYDASGIDPEWRDATTQAAYRPPGIFILRNLFRNQDYPYALGKRLLEDMGIRPDFVTLINDGLQFQSDVQVQQRVLLAVSSAYARGAATLDEMTQIAQDMKWGKVAIAALRQEAVYKRREVALSRLETAIEAAVADQLLTIDQAGEMWQAAGGDPSYWSMLATSLQVKTQTREIVKAQAVARSTARELWTNLSRAALDAYHRGEIDGAALTAALTAARAEYFQALSGYGIPPEELAPEQAITPTLVAAMVADAEAKAVASAQFVYGLTLSRDKAGLLREQVAALEAQYRDSLITAEQLHHSLLDLGIPEPYAEGIVARAAAQPVKAHTGTEKLPI